MEKISANCYKGELITNPMDIKRLALEKKSIYCDGTWGLKPAATILMMQMEQVIDAIERKQLFYVVKF